MSDALCYCYLPVDGSCGNHAGVESGLSGPALPELGPHRAAHLAAVPHVTKLTHCAYNKKYEVRIRVKFQCFTLRVNVKELRQRVHVLNATVGKTSVGYGDVFGPPGSGSVSPRYGSGSSSGSGSFLFS